MVSKQHILVLGAGIIGTTTAYYLARRGFEVSLAERESRADGRARSEVREGFAIESAGGNVFKHTGDGMIAVFDDADDAVAAAAKG